MIRTAILIDGAYLLKRLPHAYKGQLSLDDANAVADRIHQMALKHLEKRDYEPDCLLYRIFFYDCPPLQKKVHYPVSKKSLDFSKQPEAIFRLQLHQALRSKRKVALRLGHLEDKSSSDGWTIRLEVMKALLAEEKQISDLSDKDFTYTCRQKGVDMKIGLDISSLALKKQVDRIVLIAGDADFIPAAKLARREGIDFILDPMWNKIHPNLLEHIDGLKSSCPQPPSPVNKSLFEQHPQ